MENKYDTVIKPALNEIGRHLSAQDPSVLKAAIDKAADLGATPNDIVSAVGGRERWNEYIRRFKKAGLIKRGR